MEGRRRGEDFHKTNICPEEQKIGKRVAVGEAGRHLLPQVVRHMAEKLISPFFIIPSSSFIHGRNLKRFLNTINHLEATYISQDWTGLNAGILLSTPLLIKILEGCLRHSASIQCSSSSLSSLYIGKSSPG